MNSQKYQQMKELVPIVPLGNQRKLLYNTDFLPHTTRENFDRMPEKKNRNERHFQNDQNGQMTNWVIRNETMSKNDESILSVGDRRSMHLRVQKGLINPYKSMNKTPLGFDNNNIIKPNMKNHTREFKKETVKTHVSKKSTEIAYLLGLGAVLLIIIYALK